MLCGNMILSNLFEPEFWVCCVLIGMALLRLWVFFRCGFVVAGGSGCGFEFVILFDSGFVNWFWVCFCL